MLDCNGVRSRRNFRYGPRRDIARAHHQIIDAGLRYLRIDDLHLSVFDSENGVGIVAIHHGEWLLPSMGGGYHAATAIG